MMNRLLYMDSTILCSHSLFQIMLNKQGYYLAECTRFFFVFQQPFQHVKTHKLVHQKYMWYATFYQRSHLILTHFQRQINIFKTTFQHNFYVEFWRWNNVAFSTLLQLQYATIFQRWNGMIFNLRWFSGIDYLQLPFNTYSSKHILLTWIQPSCA